MGEDDKVEERKVRMKGRKIERTDVRKVGWLKGGREGRMENRHLSGV